jgi:hypothetical protein
MSEDGCGREGIFESIEGLGRGIVPCQGLLTAAEKVCEWSGYGTIVGDESAVEIGKTKKSLEFFEGGGNGPGSDGVHLPLVHADTFGTDDVS